MMTVTKMVSDCIDNPVPSRTHQWLDGEQTEYSRLHARARTLYDNLRTQYDVGHEDAYNLALDEFGFSRFYKTYGDRP